MKYDVAFVSNSGDDLHCVQAAYLMILKYFKPKFEVDWDEWARITGFEAGKGTWANAALVWFTDHGFDVKHYELFDYDAFIERGPEYMIEKNGEKVGKWQNEHTNMPAEIERAKKVRDRNLSEFREPTQSDIRQFLDDGYLLRASVNAIKLNGREGYAGHAVAIIGYTDKAFIIHDPGLPAIPDREVPFDFFEAAWADPNVACKELDAFRI